MDIFIHLIWGFIIMRFFVFTWWGLAFSIIPDLVAFIPLLLHMAATGDYTKKRWHSYFEGETWFVKLYKTMGSFTYMIPVTVLLYLVQPFLGYLMLFWLLHLALDAISHGTEKSIGGYMFYPISNFKLKFHHWSHPPYLIATWIVTLIALAITLQIT